MKIKDYFVAKSRKSESSGIMDDVCMAFCILRVRTEKKVNGIFLSKTLNDLQSLKYIFWSTKC